MNLLSDIITYIRRIVKTPSNTSLSDDLIIDYCNRFWISDVDARMQLFDFKTKYQFETIPGICDYNMPLYSAQNEPGGQIISPFPVYQGFMAPAYANGVQMQYYTQRELFFRTYPNFLEWNDQIAVGDGTTTTFTFALPSFAQVPVTSPGPTGSIVTGIIPGHIDMTGIIATGSTEDPIFTNIFLNQPVPNSSGTQATIPSTSVKSGVYITYTNANGSNTVVADSGQFLDRGVAHDSTDGDLYGLLMIPGNAPNGDLALGTQPGGTYSTTENTINYNTGVVNVTFPSTAVPLAGSPINAQCAFYQPGLPRQVLFYNNTLSIRPPPNTQYLIELDAYLTPAAMLSSSTAVPFAYMAEYIARGAARKILSDTGDWEQFAAYEPLFIEQERLVWKRSQRIITATRTATIFSNGEGQGNVGFNNSGQGGC